jgi:alkylation response protein AidB-like acyl-CoA dehydrogenase
VDFSLDAEQLAIRDTVRRLLDQPRLVRDDTFGFDPERWARLADLGVLGLTIPEEHDGMGAGPVETMLVAQELGRANAPEPVIEVAVIAAGLIAGSGTDEQRRELLPRIAQGTIRPVLAANEPGAPWRMRAHGVTARHVDGDDWTLTGVKEPVLFGDTADLLLVTAAAGDEQRLLVVDPHQPGVTRTGYATIDDRRAARVTFDRARATPLGTDPDGLMALRASVPRGVAAYAAEGLGLMEVMLDSTVDYLRSRRQFGAPLSSFQVLKHRAADMYMSLELARSMVQYAAMSLASTRPDPSAATRAKLQAGVAGRHISQEAIQLHGGIGLTDEYAIGHYAKRLVALEHVVGDARHHRELLSRTLLDHTTVDVLT